MLVQWVASPGEIFKTPSESSIKALQEVKYSYLLINPKS